MEGLGALLAHVVSLGDVLYLSGPLGSGKTTMARGFIRARGHQGKVKSPTFTLVEPYTLVSGIIYHLDLYRLDDPGEAEAMGLRDYLDSQAICLIEWPERAGDRMPPATVEVNCDISGVGRSVRIRADKVLRQQLTVELVANPAENAAEIID